MTKHLGKCRHCGWGVAVRLACLAACAGAATDKSRQSLENQRPNIIFILADDLSFKDCSFMGQKHFKTPHLDRLARAGLVFANAYAGAPECAPSRASLLTGMHLGHCRIRANESARGQDHLTRQDQTVAAVLKKAGYTCGMVGKWGVGLAGTEGVPSRQGFDYSYGFYDQLEAHTYFPHYLMENDRVVALPQNYGFNMARLYEYGRRPVDRLDDVANRYDRNGGFVADFVGDAPGAHDPAKVAYSEDLILGKALSFIRANKDRPFFLYYASQLPHGPTVVPDLGEFRDKPSPWSLKHKEWAAMVGRLDQTVGALVAELDSNSLGEKTMILFAGDNGYSEWGYFGRQRYIDDPLFKNKGPWEGGKFMCRDGGVRVPFFVYWPGRIQPGQTNHVCALYDFLETAADLAGATPDQPTDGISLVPILAGRENEQQKHRYLYWENGTFSPHGQAVKMDRWYAYRESAKQPVRLYDLEKDPGCTSDVAVANPDVVRQAMTYFKEAHVDSEWYGNPAETAAEMKAKQLRAVKEGSVQVSLRPNSTYPKASPTSP